MHNLVVLQKDLLHGQRLLVEGRMRKKKKWMVKSFGDIWADR